MAAKLTKVEPWAPQKHYDDAYSYVMKNGVSKIKDFFEEKLKNSAGEVKVKTAIVGRTAWMRKIYFYQQVTKVRKNGSIFIFVFQGKLF